MIRKIFLFMICAILPVSGFAGEKYWVFFKDKGISEHQVDRQLEQLKKEMVARTLERREKARVFGDVVDETDLDISEQYLATLKDMGVKPIVKSRWLNAVSAVMNEGQLEKVARLNFVRKIQPVAKFRFREPLPEREESLTKPQKHRLDYGESLDQNELIRVTDVHDLGFDGSGVIIGMLDTGFDYKYHEAFLSLNVVEEYDFINQDSVTQNESNDARSQHNHGTLTLSALAGFAPGKLIGPAYGATFYLAKTEDITNEYPAEEDFWVAGLEWLERKGVDVVSSSLGYLDWYTYKDMDGATAVTTLAAEIAVQKGVVVVNSMGNEGTSSWHYMIAPADGENVISVGAVTSDGAVANFSSRGPTADGRTKPDVVAMGVRVYGATAGTIDGYRIASGTSLSCPLVAGVAALILEAHPYLSPYQVAEALRNTASRADNPDNDYGWGIVDAYEALFYNGLFFSHLPEITHDAQRGHKIAIQIFSKYQLVEDSLFLYYATEQTSNYQRLRLKKGNKENSYEAWIPVQQTGAVVKCYFSARDVSGDAKKHPYFAPKDYFSFVAFDSSSRKNNPLPSDFVLFQNAPNPFAQITAIKYDIGKPGAVQITLFNLLGQKVKTIVDDFQQPGHYVRYWDGKNSAGQYVTAGIYFCRIKFKNKAMVKRMVFWGRKK